MADEATDTGQGDSGAPATGQAPAPPAPPVTPGITQADVDKAVQAAVKAAVEQANSGTQSAVTAALKAAGIEPRDQVTVESLTAKLAETDAKIADRDAQLAGYARREAVRSTVSQVPGADAERLLGQVAFVNALEKVDVSDAAAVKALVEATLATSPWLRTDAAPNSSAGDLNGGGGGTVTLEQFGKMDVGEQMALYLENQALWQQLNTAHLKSLSQ